VLNSNELLIAMKEVFNAVKLIKLGYVGRAITTGCISKHIKTYVQGGPSVVQGAPMSVNTDQDIECLGCECRPCVASIVPMILSAISGH
jgi:hypothetical protein